MAETHSSLAAARPQDYGSIVCRPLCLKPGAALAKCGVFNYNQMIQG
jgi:hypothetical protein